MNKKPIILLISALLIGCSDGAERVFLPVRIPNDKHSISLETINNTTNILISDGNLTDTIVKPPKISHNKNDLFICDDIYFFLSDSSKWTIECSQNDLNSLRVRRCSTLDYSIQEFKDAPISRNHAVPFIRIRTEINQLNRTEQSQVLYYSSPNSIPVVLLSTKNKQIINQKNKIRTIKRVHYSGGVASYKVDDYYFYVTLNNSREKHADTLQFYGRLHGDRIFIFTKKDSIITTSSSCLSLEHKGSSQFKYICAQEFLDQYGIDSERAQSLKHYAQSCQFEYCFILEDNLFKKLRAVSYRQKEVLTKP